MSTSHPKSDSRTAELPASQKLHPEDLALGDDVVISEVCYQYPSYCWSTVDRTVLPPHLPVNITFMAPGSHTPHKVKSICLPYVLCESVEGKHEVFDVRQVRMTRLDREFARLVRENHDAKSKKSNSKAKRKKEKKKDKKKKSK